MILIDSLYIAQSGGLILLKYLVSNIKLNKLDAEFLIDNRCKDEFVKDGEIRAYFMTGSENSRRKFYFANKNRYSTVLCFANVPPPIKLSAKVYTFLHNLYFLEIPKCVSFREKFYFFLKSKYLFYKNKNTDCYIVQTQYMKDVLSQKCDCPIFVLPFFEEIDIPVRQNRPSNYVYAANYQNTKRQDKLIMAWIILAEKGVFPTLHLTMGNPPKFIEELIKIAQMKGAKIINHGRLNRTEIFSLCSTCKATVYASVGESFGLGIVEAMICGCDVIGPDLPYIHTLCDPSATFIVDDVNSLADAIIRYEHGVCPRTVSSVNNRIDELVSLLANE